MRKDHDGGTQRFAVFPLPGSDPPAGATVVVSATPHLGGHGAGDKVVRSWSDIRTSKGSSGSARVPSPLLGDGPRLSPGLLAPALARLVESAPAPWSRLFHGEAAAICAQVLAFDIDAEGHAFDVAMDEDEDAAVALLGALTDQVGDWLARLRAARPAAFEETLNRLDARLGLEGSARGLETLTRLIPSTDGEALSQEEAAGGFGNLNPRLVARARRTGLRAAHRRLVHALGSLRKIAAEVLEARLAERSIDPTLGLILAELKALVEVEARINLFARRHLAFYYGDMLGQAPAPAAVERALVHLPPGVRLMRLPAQTGLLARTADGRLRRFETETEAVISPARVSATAVITYETDRQVSLYATLGAITGVRAAIEPVVVQPLDRGLFIAPHLPQPEMGFDLSSAMFDLPEGDREIEVGIEMRRASNLPAHVAVRASSPAPAGDGPDPNVLLELRADPGLVAACGFESLDEGAAVIAGIVTEEARRRCVVPSMSLILEVIASRMVDPDGLRVLLGRIVTLAVVEGAPWPDGTYWKMLSDLIDAARPVLTGERTAGQASVVLESLSRKDGSFVFSPADVFQKFFADAFAVTLSGKGGPIKPATLRLLPGAGPEGGAGFRLRLTVPSDRSAIATPPPPPGVAPDPLGAPTLSLRYAPDARICPVSFFERYAIIRMHLRVRADGLTRLAAFNDDGAVAPDQTFMPFGARAGDGSTFVVAAPEMARKPVTAIRLRLDWSDLLVAAGGFETRYALYPPEMERPDPKVAVDYLSRDRWRIVSPKPVPMIASDPVTGRLYSAWEFSGPIPGKTLPVSGTTPGVVPRARGALQAGAIRLTLSGSGEGFGQARYPLAMVDAMRPRLIPRIASVVPPRIAPRPVPDPPWLPRASGLRLGYEAEEVLDLAAPESARPGDHLVQVGPFGRVEMFPARAGREVTLFPPRLGLATLMVQVTGPYALNQLGLLFDIADAGHFRRASRLVPLTWHYLGPSGWTALPPDAIASDTTDGLRRSGVVTLDLPDDAKSDSTEMPGGGYWVAVSVAGSRYKDLPRVAGIRTNGVWVAATDGAHATEGDSARNWVLEQPIAGLPPPLEVGRRAPPRAAEDQLGFRARVSERLRHRGRAVTPWDIERLVLQEFPEVWMAKCLPHLSSRSPRPQPGQMTIVVVRHPPEGFGPSLPKQGRLESPAPEARLFDGGTLDRIRKFLEDRAPVFAGMEVVNPAFDRLRVRLSLRFRRFRDDGALSARVRTEIDRLLTVWTAPPAIGRFGWTLDVESLRARIAADDDIEALTEFSVLHLTADDAGHYVLSDTAQADGRGPHGPVIRPSRPWALPISAGDHAFTELVRSATIPPSQSGIGRLRVGDMLIVGQEARPQ
jgi:hypothetical protein